MANTDVYSWRVSSDLKSALEQQARREGKSVARVLDHVMRQWLQAAGTGARDDQSRQQRLHQEAAKFFGAIGGDNPRRSEQVRELMRKGLKQRHGRKRAH